MTRPPAPLCLITRPEPAATVFARDVEAMGLETVISPLQRIAPIKGARLPAARGVILTSAHGAAQLYRLGVARDMPCYAVGGRTAQVARDLGYHTQSAEGDADALVSLILTKAPIGPLVHIRGTHTAGRIAERLTVGGVPTLECKAYQQLAQPLTPAAHAALSGERQLFLPLFSPRSAQLLTAYPSPAVPPALFALSQAVANAVVWPFFDGMHISAAPTARAMLRKMGQVLRQSTQG
ncbi:MAG: uroporphyrinogen-III synthase [Shimia sp.]